jgi:hypothetical protein
VLVAVVQMILKGRRRRKPDRLVALADSSHYLLAARGWAAGGFPTRLFAAPFGNSSPIFTGSPAGQKPAELADVVHVIGRPVRVHQRVLLQIGEPAAVSGTSDEQLRENVVGAGLLEPEVVAPLARRLIVVQGAPVVADSRLDTERRDAADLRSWAADVFRSGQAMVISLPSLHPVLAEAVLDELARHLRADINPRAAAAATRAARAVIGGWSKRRPLVSSPLPGPAGGGTKGADRSAELAFDICLFDRPTDVFF